MCGFLCVICKKEKSGKTHTLIPNFPYTKKCFFYFKYIYIFYSLIVLKVGKSFSTFLLFLKYNVITYSSSSCPSTVLTPFM